MIKSFLLFISCVFIFASCNIGMEYEDFEYKYHVGDIILNSGTVISGSIESLTDAQKSSAVAVIFYVGGKKGEIGHKALGVGLEQQKAGAWCSGSANANNIYVKSVECEIHGNDESGQIQYLFTFSGDIDGSDNLFQIGEYLKANGLSDDTDDENKYPLFYFAKNYKNIQQNIIGSQYEDGWYVPSVAELFQIRKNLSLVNSSLRKLDRYAFGSDWAKSWYTSSSQSASDKNRMCSVRITDGYCSSRGIKSNVNSGYVCAIRCFD